MTITLLNTSGRIKAFTLSHESYCMARGRCACAMTSSRNARRVPASLTLVVGARMDDLDEAVLAVPDIRRALNDGELKAQRAGISLQKRSNS